MVLILASKLKIEDLKKTASLDGFLLDTSKYKEKNFKAILDFIRKNEADNPVSEIKFTYTKEVKAAPRPRKGKWGFYNPASKNKKEIQEYLRKVFKREFRNGSSLIKGVSKILIRFYKPIPKSFNMTQIFLAEMGYIEPEHPPDVDNYSKTVMDAMIGTIMVDDDIITKLTIQKLYSAAPRVEVIFQFRKMNMLPTDSKR